MKIDILTLFPNMFTGFLEESIIKRALNKKLVKINVINFRDYSTYNNNQVDDTPYGGGSGMVLMCDPIFRAIDDLKEANTKVVLMTPDGEVYNQNKAISLSKEKHLIIICGHYEGFDERIRSIIDYEISVGDYILTGGEIPAMSVVDSVTRLIEGVITSDSLVSESFNDNLLDYPVYTKPQTYRGMSVPEVLVNGNHKFINEWRRNEQIKKTKERRPDLLK